MKLKYSSIIIVLLMVVVIGTSAYADVLVDGDDKENNITDYVEVGSYVGIDVDSPNENTNHTMGSAVNMGQLMSSNNGNIRVWSRINSYYTGQIKLFYNGRYMGLVGKRDKNFYVNKGDELIFKLSEPKRIDKTVWWISKWDANGSHMGHARYNDTQFMLDLSDITKAGVVLTSKTLAQTFPKYTMADKGGVYDLIDDYDDTFTMNTLTGRVLVLDERKVVNLLAKNASKRIKNYTNFISSGSVRNIDGMFAFVEQYLTSDPDTTSNKTGVLCSIDKLSLDTNFEIKFKANFGHQTADTGNTVYDFGNNGTGMVFYLTPNRIIDSIKTYDGSIGYSKHSYGKPANYGLKKSIAVEFDTFKNQNNGYGTRDANVNAMGEFKGNHISVNRNTMIDTEVAADITKENGDKVKFVPYLLEDGRFHDVSISWDAEDETMKIMIDNNLIGNVVLKGDVVFPQPVYPYLNTTRWKAFINSLKNSSGQVDTNGSIKSWDKVHFGFIVSNYTQAIHDIRGQQKFIKDIEVYKDAKKIDIKVSYNDQPNVNRTFSIYHKQDKYSEKFIDLLDEAREISTDIIEGFSDYEIIGKDRYDVGEYKVGSNYDLQQAIWNASKFYIDFQLLEQNNQSTIDEIEDKISQLKAEMDKIHKYRVTENNKITVKAVSSETGKVFWSETLYGPVDDRLSIHPSNGKDGVGFKIYLDKQNIWKDISTTSNFDTFPSGYALYSSPQNRNIIFDDISKDKTNANRKKIEDFEMRFTTEPQVVYLMYRQENKLDSSPVPSDYRENASTYEGDEYTIGWSYDAFKKIKWYSNSKNIPWKNKTHYQFVDFKNAGEDEKLTLLNMLQNTRRWTEDNSYKYKDKTPVYEDVERYYEDIKNAVSDISDMDKLSDMYKKYDLGTKVDDSYYFVFPNGKIDITAYNKDTNNTIRYDDEFSVLTAFQTPKFTDAGTSKYTNEEDVHFLTKINNTKYLKFDYPDVKLYVANKGFDFKGKNIKDLVEVNTKPVITELANGKGYEVDIPLVKSTGVDITAEQQYLVRIDSKVLSNEDYLLSAEYLSNNGLTSYNLQTPEEVLCKLYQKMRRTDKLDDPVYGGKKLRIAPHEIVYAISNIKDSKGFVSDINNLSKLLSISTTPIYYLPESQKNDNLPVNVTKFFVKSDELLPGSN